jgi:hypothetical protein
MGTGRFRPENKRIYGTVNFEFAPKNTPDELQLNALPSIVSHVMHSI